MHLEATIISTNVALPVKFNFLPIIYFVLIGRHCESLFPSHFITNSISYGLLDIFGWFVFIILKMKTATTQSYIFVIDQQIIKWAK